MGCASGWTRWTLLWTSSCCAAWCRLARDTRGRLKRSGRRQRVSSFVLDQTRFSSLKLHLQGSSATSFEQQLSGGVETFFLLTFSALATLLAEAPLERARRKRGAGGGTGRPMLLSASPMLLMLRAMKEERALVLPSGRLVDSDGVVACAHGSPPLSESVLLVLPGLLRRERPANSNDGEGPASTLSSLLVLSGVSEPGAVEAAFWWALLEKKSRRECMFLLLWWTEKVGRS